VYPVSKSEWNTCDDPQALLSFLAGRASQRKLRLLAVACCRQLFTDVIAEEQTRAAIGVAERYADGWVTKQDLTAARQAATAAWEPSWRAKRAVWWTTYGRAAAAARGVLGQPVPPPWRHDGLRAPRERPAPLARAALAPLCAVVRDLFGPPVFREVHIEPAWLAWKGGATVRLARAIYDERELPPGHLDAARLAVLADMLEEAGCCDGQLLLHLRGPGPHVRGCFAVDAILGKG
jgi:hypothetical protein